MSVAGTFNNWNRDANPMARQPDGRTWGLTLRLEPGAYQYKFVLNGSQWINDPARPTIDDGNGNLNNELIVTPPEYDTQPGVIGDDRITANAVRHRPTAPDVSRIDATHIRLTLHTRHNDVRACTVLIRPDPSHRIPALNAQRSTLNALSFPMSRSDSDPLFDTWQATVPISPPATVRYAFVLRDGPTQRLYDARERLLNTGSGATGWFTARPADYPPFLVPDWAHDAVFYQIFPDRFADGDPTNDGPDAHPFGSKPDFFSRQGGDLAGVEQHLDYLRDLGINALYFNPIFTARSNHGYDTTDYLQVDPHLGTNEQLTNLTGRVHALGWHVILDGVFNHTGVDFAAFKSLRDAGESSPYRSWYFVRGFPIEVKDNQTNYTGWFGSPWMPKLNVDNPDTRAYLLDVSTRWIRQTHIDGWRLDAADEVKHSYWQAFRKTVRAVDPQAYIVGEIWGDARDWLQGDQFDSVMNYRWRGAVLDFFAFDKTGPSRFDAALTRIRNDYPPAATAVMFNILDSHDTERVRTLCKGDWGRERQAVLFQLTYPGTPCIYYGDEIGMEGGRDPDDRRAMVWDSTRWDQPTLDFYRRLLALRHKHEVLRRGDYRTVLADDSRGLFGFVRTLGHERALVVFNRSDAPQTASLSITSVGGHNVAANLADWLDAGTKVQVHGDRLIVTLSPRGIALLAASHH